MSKESTAREILEGAKNLITENGYVPGVGQGEHGEYSIPAAFDKVVFDDARFTEENFLLVMLGGPAIYPETYQEAREALLSDYDAHGQAMTKEAALVCLNSGLAYLDNLEAAA